MAHEDIPQRPPTGCTLESPATSFKRQQFPRISEQPLSNLIDLNRQYQLFTLSPDTAIPQTARPIASAQTMMLDRFMNEPHFQPIAYPSALPSVAPPTSLSIIGMANSEHSSVPPLPASTDELQILSREPVQDPFHAPQIQVNEVPVISPETPHLCDKPLELPESKNQKTDLSPGKETLNIHGNLSGRLEAIPTKSHKMPSGIPNCIEERREHWWRQTELTHSSFEPELLYKHVDTPIEPPASDAFGKYQEHSAELQETSSESTQEPVREINPHLRVPLHQLQTIFASPESATSARFPLMLERSPVNSSFELESTDNCPVLSFSSLDSAVDGTSANTPTVPLSLTGLRITTNLPSRSFDRQLNPSSPLSDSVPATPLSMVSSNSTMLSDGWSVSTPITPTQSIFSIKPVFEEPSEEEMYTPVGDDMLTPVQEEQYTPITSILASYENMRSRPLNRDHSTRKATRSLSPRSSKIEYENPIAQIPTHVNHGTVLAMASVPGSGTTAFEHRHRRQMTCTQIEANAPVEGKNVILQSYSHRCFV